MAAGPLHVAAAAEVALVAVVVEELRMKYAAVVVAVDLK